MKIVVTSVLVDDQAKALAFYTDVLGFVKKTDVPAGGARWLTVVSPDAPDGVELLLEPDAHPAARPFKEALVEDGMPYTSFGVDDVQREFDRLSGARRALHAAADRHGAGDDRRLRRHLREPHPDRLQLGIGSGTTRRCSIGRSARRLPGGPRV